ncbi:MAG: hypothetical protein JO020_13985 [Chloroflexi bacterium]|nr:hypothetical protein [Chloroflexota bacterium]MBV9895275.1 hypothetical protein [Chloroflexota bacterium]
MKISDAILATHANIARRSRSLLLDGRPKYQPAWLWTGFRRWSASVLLVYDDIFKRIETDDLRT